MTRNELIELTLDQLIETFSRVPEAFTLETFDCKYNSYTSAVMWRHLININGVLQQDPNNPTRTLIMAYNKKLREIKCLIYNVNSVFTLGASVFTS